MARSRSGWSATSRSRSEYGVNSWENFKAVLGDEVAIEIVVEANAGYQLARALVCLFE
ncbi:MAG: hypothetical protein QGG05_04870 [Candidatus Latescibacteria bacterium]|jgi:hypothetical protein|nr:hypothetical protein [Candidatus Latescibacterota bacterium]